MSYKNLVKAKVRMAFAMVKDLAETVTLTQKNNTAYNFDTNLPTTTSVVSTTVKGILMEKKRSSNETEMDSGKEMQMLFMASDLDDPDLYDTVTMLNGDVWTIAPPCISDGYIITANLARSA